MGWLILRAALAATFAVAGTAKLVSPASTRVSVRSFGAPEVASGAAALCLPLLELAVAGALLATPTATAGAWAALGLVAAFTAAIALALARGEQPECNCFGRLSSQRAGAGTLARNGLLGVAALVCAIGGPGESVGRALDGVSAGTLAAAAALVVVLGAVATISVQLWRQNGRLLVRIEALEAAMTQESGSASSGDDQTVGSPAPDFLVWDDDERVYSLADLLAPGEPVVLAFTDPDCPGCRMVKPLLERAREAGTQIALITRGDRESVPGALRQLDREVMAAYRAHVVPSAVLVDSKGRIASELARGADAVADLLESAVSVG